MKEKIGENENERKWIEINKGIKDTMKMKEWKSIEKRKEKKRKMKRKEKKTENGSEKRIKETKGIKNKGKEIS